MRLVYKLLKYNIVHYTNLSIINIVIKLEGFAVRLWQQGYGFMGFLLYPLMVNNTAANIELI